MEDEIKKITDKQALQIETICDKFNLTFDLNDLGDMLYIKSEIKGILSGELEHLNRICEKENLVLMIDFNRECLNIHTC